jgi:hypothetical protein
MRSRFGTFRYFDSSPRPLSHLWFSALLGLYALGCSSGFESDPHDEVAAAEITCDDSQPQLAPHLHLLRRVDFVADRYLDRVLSSAGEPCSGAVDREPCRAAVQVPYEGGRHLLTTEGDSVRVWEGTAALELLGKVDTGAEALWLAAATGRLVTCDSAAEATALGFVLTGVRSSGLCPNVEPQPVDLEVRSSGLIIEDPPLEDQPCPPTP